MNTLGIFALGSSIEKNLSKNTEEIVKNTVLLE